MAYSNSKLVTVEVLSNNHNNRTSKIDKVVIHYMAGDLSVESCGEWFQKSNNSSSNYGIGSDGRIGLFVPEKYRAWTTGNARVDQRAITIEVANKAEGKITDKAMKSLIELVADICKRNGIKKCTYTGGANGTDATNGKKGTLQQHHWYQSTSCPGPYLKKKFTYIAEQVNKILGAKGSATSGTVSSDGSSSGSRSASDIMSAMPDDIRIRAEALMKYYNQLGRSLSINGCTGDYRVRGGSSVVVKMEFDDIKVSNWMLVEKVVHKFENGRHSMDLTLTGGQFNQ